MMEITANDNVFDIDVEPGESIYDVMWGVFSKTVGDSIITTFDLAFIKDQYGGDVDTLQNITDKDGKPYYRNDEHEEAYKNKGDYNKDVSKTVHSNEAYKKINEKISKALKKGTLKDEYTGKLLDDKNLDHVVSAKEVFDDPGRILAGLKTEDLANSPNNLKATLPFINKNKQAKTADEYIAYCKKQINILEHKENPTEKDLKKLEHLKSIDQEKLRELYNKSKLSMKLKEAGNYYGSKDFALGVNKAAFKVGAKMAVKQILGILISEIWFAVLKELKRIKVFNSFMSVIKAIGRGIKKARIHIQRKFKTLLKKLWTTFKESYVSSLITSFINTLASTPKRIVTMIRRVLPGLYEALNVLLFNPQELPMGDRIKNFMVLLTSSAATVAGIYVEQALSGLDILQGFEYLKTFLSTFFTGILSNACLCYLDRSKRVKKLVATLNSLPEDYFTYKNLSSVMDGLVPRIEKFDKDEYTSIVKEILDKLKKWNENGNVTGPDYDKATLFDKIKNNIKNAGKEIIRNVIILYSLSMSENCPTKIKIAIWSAISYFILPLDTIPDPTPIFGYTDDAAALLTAMKLAKDYIDEGVLAQADKIYKEYIE